MRALRLKTSAGSWTPKAARPTGSGREAIARPDVERLADEDDGPLPEGWESTIELGVPEPKKGVHIRLDPHVLRWFKAQGPGYQTRINAVLRGFVEARERSGDGDRKAE